MEYDSAKVPKMFKTVRWRSRTVNLDVGGGYQEDATLYLAERKVHNVVYDPDHRSAEHNAEAISFVLGIGGSHSVTLSDVLNLYTSWKDRDAILYYSKFLARKGAPIYISVYDDIDKYTDAIAKRFRIINISSDMITAIKAD